MKRWSGVVVLGVALAVVVVMPRAAHAQQADTCIPVRQATPSPITVRTLPITPGFTFTLDGTEYVTGADGTASLSTDVPCKVTERLIPSRAPVAIKDGERAIFARWYGRGLNQTATFVREYRIELDYRDLQKRAVDPKSLDHVTIRSSLGVRQELKGTDAPWLMGKRIVPSAVALEVKPVYWTVETVDVGGLDIVNRAQFKFFPETDRHPEVRLLYFAAKMRARDAFFGFSMGDEVKLEYPNGRVEMHKLDKNSELTLDHLPRGEYQITARGPGLRISRPVAITRNQDVDLKVLSYLDLAVVGLVALGFAVGLVLIGRRRRRRRRSSPPRRPDRQVRRERRRRRTRPYAAVKQPEPVSVE